MAAVPLAGTDGGEEVLHALFVAEQLAVQVTRVPVDKHATEIEDDDLCGLGSHVVSMSEQTTISSSRQR